MLLRRIAAMLSLERKTVQGAVARVVEIRVA